MATIYKGTLRGKRKNELLEMATALGLSMDEDATKRDDVETKLKSYFVSHRSKLQNTPQWAGIYHSIDQSDKRAAQGHATVLSPDSDASDDGAGARKHSHKSRASALVNGVTASTPLRRTSNMAVAAEEGASNIASALSAKARRSIEDLSAAFRTSTSNISNEVRSEVQDAAADVSQAGTQAKRTARRSVNRWERRVDAAFVRARTYLSDADNIALLLLIIEASLLVTRIMPWTTIQLGQSPVRSIIKNAATGKGLGASPHASVTLPNLWAFLTINFWRPIVLWSAWTVALPLLFAHLITFDRKHEPSALSFSLVRLAILSGVSKRILFTSKVALPHIVGVTAGEAREVTANYFGSWLQLVEAICSYDYVAPFLTIDSQLMLSSLAAAFAAYEVVAHRPRA